MTVATEADAAVADAVASLRAGKVVCYPTETVYGLGADACSSAALDALAELKREPRRAPFSVLVSGVVMAQKVCGGPLPEAARRLAECFWPGPLTLVVPCHTSLDARVLGEGRTIGLRCSSDPLAAALVRAFAGPLTSTSANRAGATPASTVEQARDCFGDAVAAYVDGGLRRSPLVSTVVEVVSARGRILRPGAVSEQELARRVRLEH